MLELLKDIGLRDIDARGLSNVGACDVTCEALAERQALHWTRYVLLHLHISRTMHYLVSLVVTSPQGPAGSPSMQGHVHSPLLSPILSFPRSFSFPFCTTSCPFSLF
jgi:hypothetical protein